MEKNYTLLRIMVSAWKLKFASMDVKNSIYYIWLFSLVFQFTFVGIFSVVHHSLEKLKRKENASGGRATANYVIGSKNRS